jgi:hypothetical protein
MQMQRLPLVGDHLFGGTTSKSKSFPGGESLKDSDASRWSAVTFFSDTTKLVLDSGGLLMEAMTVREWFLPRATAGRRRSPASVDRCSTSPNLLRVQMT